MVYERKIYNVVQHNNMPFQYFYLVALGMYTYASLYKY